MIPPRAFARPPLWRLARMAAAAATLLAVSPAEAAGPCGGPYCNLETLRPYFAKLARARGARGQRPVHILQIGDSHTAGDVTPGAWRAILQAQAGSGGRGAMAPGRPYVGYTTKGVTAAMSGGWTITSTFGKTASSAYPLGFASFSATSTRPGATIGLSSDGVAMWFDRFVLCGIEGPGVGAVTVNFSDGSQSRLDFGGPTRKARCDTLLLDRTMASFTITTEDRPVTLTSWGTFRDNGGVVLSNVGVVGSQLLHFGKTSDEVVKAEFDAYQPDLIVLAFGTNEGFTPQFSASGYEGVLRAQIRRLRRLAGADVPILLLGAPDALSRQPILRNNADGLPVDCPPLDQPLLGDSFLPPPVTTTLAPLFAPPGLAAVRQVQRRVAASMSVAYWDWVTAMGGPCTAQKWVKRTPPLMRTDYVHFLNGGGAIVAAKLQADLSQAARGR